MDRASYRDRATPPPLPTVEERLANLEAAQKAFASAVRDWCADHQSRAKRWRETHAGDHEALSDHVYALDAQIRRLQ